MSFNGWSNKETWLVQCWFGDNLAELAADGDDITADYIKNYIESMIDMDDHSVESGFMADIIATALAEINWRELAEHYVEEEEV